MKGEPIDLKTASLETLAEVFFDKSYNTADFTPVVNQITNRVKENPELATQDLLNKLTPLLDNKWKLQREGCVMISKLVEENSDLATAGLLGKLKVLVGYQYYQNLDAALPVVITLIKQNSDLATEDLLGELISLLTNSGQFYKHGDIHKVINTLIEVKPEFTYKTLLTSTSLLLKEDTNKATSVAELILRLVNERAFNQISEAETVLSSLIEVLKNNREYDVSPRVGKAIVVFVEKNPTLATPDSLNKLTPLLQHKDSNVQVVAVKALSKHIEKNPELATSDLLDRLILLLPREKEDLRKEANQAIIKFVETKPDLGTEALTKLTALLETGNSFARNQAAKLIPVLVVKDKAYATEDLLNKLTSLLNSTLLEVKKSAVQVITELVAQDSFPATEDLLHNLMLLLQVQQLEDILKMIGQAIIALVKQNQGLGTVVLSKTPLLVGNANKSNVAKTLNTYVVKNVDLAAEADLDKLIPLLQHSETEVRGAVFSAINKLIEQGADLVTLDILAKLIPLLQDKRSDVKVAGIKVFGKLIEKKPDLATEGLLGNFISLLSDAEQKVQQEAVKVITKFAEQSELLPATITQLTALLEADNANARSQAAKLIPVLVVKDEAYATEDLLNKLTSFLGSKRLEVAKIAGQVITSLVEQDSHLATEDLLNNLMLLLQDQQFEKALSVVGDAIITLVKQNLNLGTFSLPTLMPLLVGQNESKSKVANTLITSIATQSIELATEVLDNLILQVQDEVPSVRDKAGHVITELIFEAKLGHLSNKAVTELYKLFEAGKLNGNYQATKVILQLVEPGPQFATKDLLDNIIPFLNDVQEEVRDEACWFIGEYIKAREPGLATVENLMTLLQHTRQDLRDMAIDLLMGNVRDEDGTLWAGNRTLLSKALLSDLEPLLQHQNKYLREAAAKAITVLVGKKASLATSELLDKLIPSLQDTEQNVQLTTAKAISKVIDKNQELGTVELGGLLKQAVSVSQELPSQGVNGTLQVGSEGEGSSNLFPSLPDPTTMAALTTITTATAAALESQAGAHLNKGLGGSGAGVGGVIEKGLKAATAGSPSHAPDGSGSGLKIVGFILAISATALLAKYVWQKYASKQASTDALDPEPTSAVEMSMYLVQFSAYQVSPLGEGPEEIV